MDAIKAAKEKAMALAEALGQKIGKPITISEGTSAQPYYKRAMQNSVRAMDAGAEESGGSIAPGEIKIEANVSVTFELE